MKKRLIIEIYGRVQGVNFRQNTQRVANTFEITGFVMNKGDDTVYIEAEGSEPKLKKLLSWAQKGDFPAKVTGMNYHWENATDKFNTFEIRREGNYVVDRVKGVLNLGKRIVTPHEKLNAPKHIVIIPDGNRRWARAKGWKAYIGHKVAGTSEDNIRQLFKTAGEYGVEYITIWGFSTENWERSEEEISMLWKIFRGMFSKWKEEFVTQGIKFKHLGRKDRLPKDIVESMQELETLTASNSRMHFQLCLDYGGRDEIVRAVNRLIKEGNEEVSEEMLLEYLDTENSIPDPDLIIRTSGEKRTSGIMAFQGAYAELYFLDKPFPEFNKDDLTLAILDYSARTRRFGGTSKEDLKDVEESMLIEPEDGSLEKSLNV